ncbi:Smr/MutS family protein [Bartonella krasnovii]|uniref:Smr domain-containing protein n=1 Tax=Bartonella krasnovii TaxID=2267275 RepID=A0A5B9D402_9HYPH|nr:Smr/MutS family protein [Bartonella krasnovii]QEE13089.1 Smr domain-containing protein [Bartonella krasnovii]UNF29204.1 Smr/MutS family protein [Bartonella krasnovii]UNF35561.1 Smr/MutS family protein [Bartonella krasnovii]UNF37177.1 Smr/MutS family protein [Bartonella krasnovii]UNF38876.1 Smr/MutS family protein [Bartonella krasnovii]
MSLSEWRQKRDLLTSQDRLLWAKVCRTITPLHDKRLSSISENIANINDKKQCITQAPLGGQENQQRSTIIKKEKRAVTQTHKIHFFDHVAHRKIAQGRYPLEARLDLHGYMQEEAYFFLKKFLQSSQQSGLRYVLVITGKGRSIGSDGALYRFVPYWLSTPAFRYYVHAFEQAARQHGGEGALYVWLRRFVSRKGM